LSGESTVIATATFIPAGLSAGFIPAGLAPGADSAGFPALGRFFLL
jgi:hypothetical protein